jgi:hypothetical protein
MSSINNSNDSEMKEKNGEQTSPLSPHVKFNIVEEEFKGHHNNLEIVRNDEHLFYIDVGYLKAHHQYRMAFDFKFKFDNLIYCKEKSTSNVILEEVNIILLSLLSNEKTLILMSNIFASEKIQLAKILPTEKVYNTDYNEKNLNYFTKKKVKKTEDGFWHLIFIHLVNKDTISGDKVYFNLSNNDTTKVIEIHFEARVLGEEQGTPSLRNGITLIHNSQHHPVNLMKSQKTSDKSGYHPNGNNQTQTVHQIC